MSQAVVARELDDHVRAGWRLLTLRGLVVLGVGVLMLLLGLLWRYSTMVGVAVAICAAVLVDLASVLGPVQVRVRREIDHPVVERHGDCNAILTVTGRRLSLARTTLAEKVGRHTIHVEPDGSTVSYRVPTLRRGLLPVGPLTVSRIGPFGLAMSRRDQGEVEHVRILPKQVPLHRLDRGRRRSAVGADESVEHGGTDLVGLHEYVPGDDLRRLHWATSARTGQLMVRDDADPSTPHLTVVLDDTAAHYADHASTGTDFEDAVEVAFALCRAAVEHSYPMQLVTTSGTVDVVVSERIGAAAMDVQRVYSALAEVQPSDVPTAEANVAGSERAATAARGMRLQKSLDSVAVISGGDAPLDALVEVASRGATGKVLLVDHAGHEPVSATGRIQVMRGPRSIDLATLWDRAAA